MPDSKQSSSVGNYFDEISGDYTSRYSEQNPFHNYFFRDRLELATAGFDFANKSVLDIGAGTGALYDHLSANTGLDYYACDISGKMLEQSNIPKERRFVGKVTEISFPRPAFDFIFMLGVTTYQSPDDLRDTIQFISRSLAPNGRAIVTFTNRGGIDHAARSAMRLAKPFIKRGVIAQDFPTYAYSSKDADRLFDEAGLHVARVSFLNHAFSPFNTLLPTPSVALAKAIRRFAPAPALPLLSSDFLVVANRA